MANADGFITWYNDKWYQYTGTTPAQMEGWGWQSVHDPEMLPRILERWKHTLATGQPFDMEFPLRGQDGEFHWFLTRVMPMKDADGRVVRWFGTNTDITEREQNRVALRHSEEQYRSFVEASAQVVWTTNAVGEVDMDIPSWQAFTGQAAEEARGLGWMDVIRHEDHGRVVEAWHRAVQSCGLYEVEYLLRRHEGDGRNILARGVPVLNPDGSIREYIGTCIDITDRRRQKEELRESEERFASSSGKRPWASSRIDRRGRILEVNAKLCGMLGDTPAVRSSASRSACYCLPSVCQEEG